MRRVLVITTGCNPSGGGFPLRVHSILQMSSQIADVSVLSIYDPFVPQIAGVKFFHQLFPENLSSKITRLTSFYRTKFEPVRVAMRPDIVQIEHPSFFGLAAQFPGVPVILDEHNVWWQLEIYNIQEGPTLKRVPFRGPLIRWLLGRARKYEIEVLRKSSQVIVCSAIDRDIIIKEVPSLKSRIHYIPNCLDTERYQTGEGDSKIVLFMGSPIYFPNKDAVHIICEDIAPEVDAEFHILGGDFQGVKTPPNVKLLGRVEDVRPYIREAGVCIAPLRFGSGSRIKIIEYMACGKAVVSTTKGAEALEVTHGEDILIEDDMRRFRDLIIALLKDAQRRQAIGRVARLTVEKKYDYRLYAETLKDIYLRTANAS